MYTFLHKKLLAASCSILAVSLSIAPVASSDLGGAEGGRASVTHPFIANLLTGSNGNYDTSFLGMLPTEVLDEIISVCDQKTSGALALTNTALTGAVVDHAGRQGKYLHISDAEDLAHYPSLIMCFPDVTKIPVYFTDPAIQVNKLSQLEHAHYLFLICPEQLQDAGLKRLSGVRQLMLKEPLKITDDALKGLHKDTKMTVLFDEKNPCFSGTPIKLSPNIYKHWKTPEKTPKLKLSIVEKLTKERAPAIAAAREVKKAARSKKQALKYKENKAERETYDIERALKYKENKGRNEAEEAVRVAKTVAWVVVRPGGGARERVLARLGAVVAGAKRKEAVRANLLAVQRGLVNVRAPLGIVPTAPQVQNIIDSSRRLFDKPSKSDSASSAISAALVDTTNGVKLERILPMSFEEDEMLAERRLAARAASQAAAAHAGDKRTADEAVVGEPTAKRARSGSPN